jgi:hypothetical protein
LRSADTAPRVLIVGCGALAREIVALTRDLPNVDVTCLPATLHNRPGGIPAAVRDRIRRRRAGYDRVFVAYADCGTGGMLDRVLEEEGVERLPGAHCYEFYATRPDFARLTHEEPATFFLTDFLARNFDRLVIKGLGLDRHPELLDQYFGNYKRVVYLAQTDDPELVRAGRRGAARLGLAFELRHTGYGELATELARVSQATNRLLRPDTALPAATFVPGRHHEDAGRAVRTRNRSVRGRSVVPHARAGAAT